jgi:nucleoside 2-deoxyribosyltransferase
MSKPNIFISYNKRDAEVARLFGAALEKEGLNAFNTDQELQEGEDWRKTVQAGIKRSDAVILLALTPHHLDSSWMAYEAGLAEALGKKVVLLLPNKYSVAELPADFASTTVLDFDPQAPQLAARKFATRLT